MGLTEIRKELIKLDQGNLVNLIIDLYKRNKSVKDFFDFYVNPNEKELFNTYKDKVYQAFYPKRGFGHKLIEGKQAISDFKKLGASTELIADLMLFYVETGVKFTNEYGDIDENFYSSLEKTYVQALTLMKKEDLLNNFADRVQDIVDDTENIGWGFHDYLSQVYADFY